MQVTSLESAAILIEDGGTTLRCEPWVVDGACYGSWARDPPPNGGSGPVSADYSYVAPSDAGGPTPGRLERLDPATTVLVHESSPRRLCESLEERGVETVELPRDRRVHVGGDLHVRALESGGGRLRAPRIEGECGGSRPTDEWPGSYGSAVVVDNGRETAVVAGGDPTSVVDSADGTSALERGEVDLLCHRFTASGWYPQRLTGATHAKKLRERERLVNRRRDRTLELVDAIEPRLFAPLRDAPLLTGELALLNEYTPTVRPERVAELARRDCPTDVACIPLHAGTSFDLERGTRVTSGESLDSLERWRYIDDVLRVRRFDYEDEPMPARSVFEPIVTHAYENLEERRNALGFASETPVRLPIGGGTALEVSMNGDGFEYVSMSNAGDGDALEIDADPRLVTRLLDGRRASWDVAAVGSHLGFDELLAGRERNVYACLRSFARADRVADTPV